MMSRASIDTAPAAPMVRSAAATRREFQISPWPTMKSSIVPAAHPTSDTAPSIDPSEALTRGMKHRTPRQIYKSALSMLSM